MIEYCKILVQLFKGSFTSVLVNSLLSDFLFSYHSHFSDGKKESSVPRDLREVDGNASFSVVNRDHFIPNMLPVCSPVTRSEVHLASLPTILRSKALLSTLSEIRLLEIQLLFANQLHHMQILFTLPEK